MTTKTDSSGLELSGVPASPGSMALPAPTGGSGSAPHVAAGAPRARIFVNYRNTDEPYAAALIDHVVSARFGADTVFRASKSIRMGEDFEERILVAVRQADVLLSLIGPGWARARDRAGVPRLPNPKDWVRREIAEAFRHGVRVVPVLLGAGMPDAGALPRDIRALVRCQYVEVDPRNSWQDLRMLTDELVRLIPGLDRSS